MKKLVVFDYDGVIVDSLDICYQCALQSNPKITLPEYRNLFAGNFYTNISSRSFNVGDLDKYMQNYTDLIMNRPPVDSVSTTLNALRAKGITTAINTSTYVAPIQAHLQKYQIDNLFDKVYGGDTEGSKVKKFEMISRDFGVDKSDMLFVTDTLGDLRESSEANVTSVAVSYGFHDAQTLRTDNPDQIVVDNLSDILNYIN